MRKCKKTPTNTVYEKHYLKLQYLQYVKTSIKMINRTTNPKNINGRQRFKILNILSEYIGLNVTCKSIDEITIRVYSNLTETVIN